MGHTRTYDSRGLRLYGDETTGRRERASERRRRRRNAQRERAVTETFVSARTLAEVLGIGVSTVREHARHLGGVKNRRGFWVFPLGHAQREWHAYVKERDG